MDSRYKLMQNDIICCPTQWFIRKGGKSIAVVMQGAFKESLNVSTIAYEGYPVDFTSLTFKELFDKLDELAIV